MSLDFLSHLEELRRRILISLAIFFAASIVCYFFSHQILDFLIFPLRRFGNTNLFFQTPYEAFFIHIKAAAFAGLFFSSPIFFAQAWFFVSPGLYETEKRAVLPLIFISSLLFIVGAGFAYQFAIPWGLNVLLSFQTESLRPLLAIGPYFSFLVGMVLAFGILFDFPVIILGLVRLGVLKSTMLISFRRGIIVAIFIVAAVLTPSPDPISQLLLAIPLYLLFEVSVVLAKWMEAKRATGEGGHG